MTADFVTNQIGSTIVIAPTMDGRLSHIAEHRQIVFQREGTKVEPGLTRWIFSDIPKRTLKDSWGNAYDHQVHFLLSGTLQDGKNFIAELIQKGFSIQAAERLFVPFQTLDASDESSSDKLRINHPRAFALARRESPDIGHLTTALRDALILGNG